jgi:hypothetical protein
MSSGQPPRHIRNIPIVCGLYRWNTGFWPAMTVTLKSEDELASLTALLSIPFLPACA